MSQVIDSSSGMGLAKAEALLATPKRYRSAYISDRVKAEALQVAVTRAKRKNLWALPAKVPAWAPTAFKKVPHYSAILAYVGDPIEAIRIQCAMLARANASSVAA
jgi:hypothetical protein